MPLTLDTSELVDAADGDAVDPSLDAPSPNGEQVAEALPSGEATAEATPETEAESESVPQVAATGRPRFKTDPAYLKAKEIEAARDRLCAATMAEMRAKSAAKIAKLEREAAAEALSELMRGEPVEAVSATAMGESSEAARGGVVSQAPAEAVADSPADGSGDGDGDGDLALDEAASQSRLAPPPDDDSWREVELNELDIPESTLGKLMESAMETVGDLSDYMNQATKKGDPTWYAQLSGVGKAKAEKIEQALEKFWADRKVASS